MKSKQFSAAFLRGIAFLAGGILSAMPFAGFSQASDSAKTFFHYKSITINGNDTVVSEKTITSDDPGSLDTMKIPGFTFRHFSMPDFGQDFPGFGLGFRGLPGWPEPGSDFFGTDLDSLLAGMQGHFRFPGDFDSVFSRYRFPEYDSVFSSWPGLSANNLPRFRNIYIEDVENNDENDAGAGIKVILYPDVMTGELVIEAGKQSSGTVISVLDGKDQLVHQETLALSSGGTTRRISLKDYPNGSYLIKIEHGDYTLLKRMEIH